jgi:hypothetical protein
MNIATHRLLPFAALAAIGLIAACQPMDQPTPLEAVATGAAIGAIVAGEDDLVEGAVVGGIVGAAASSVLSQTNDNQCLYREIATGREFIAPC